MSHVGNLIRTRREQAHLSRKEVAVATGYKNLNKQLRFLAALEDGTDEFPKETILERFARVLGIDETEIVETIDLDYAEFLRWRDTPVELRLELRLMPCVYIRRSLPHGCTMPEAENIAKQICIDKNMMVWLIYSRGLAKIYHPPDGHMRFGSRSVVQIGRYNRWKLTLAKRQAKVATERVV